ncbi:MAG TPA: DNA primase DnaG [Candidatus Binatia bacterium]|nr:DNA primase DnaG [Candidatus Binatia bacterium]
MGKISPVSSKYIVHSTIEIDGIVDRPDVIGAIFGQTEGLLGEELELRELQRSGRIGRIEVNLDARGGKSSGAIIIPSSLDKAETAVIAAALEIIQRIGPCNAKVRVTNIEDVRISKRQFVLERAKELLRNMMDSGAPDSQEITEEVINSVRVQEVVEYGRDRLPAGPGIEDADEVIVVEGRADVVNLLKHGFKNVIAMNGTQVPPTISELSQKKDIVVFVDGDRGGNLILKEVLAVAEVDFVTKAPDGKEVEELAKKEIHKALRSRITAEQAKLELAAMNTSESIRKPMIQSLRPQDRGRTASASMPPRRESMPAMRPAPVGAAMRPVTAPVGKKPLSASEKEKFEEVLTDLIGTRGACLLDEKLGVLGKVPLAELPSTLSSLTSGVYAVVLDESVDSTVVQAAEKANVKYLIGMDTKVKPADSRVTIMTSAEL